MLQNKSSVVQGRQEVYGVIKVMLISSLFVILGISAFASLRSPAAGNLRGMLESPGGDITANLAVVAQLTSSDDLLKAQASAKSARELQELYLQMVSSMINNPGSQGTNASFMSLMQQMISAQQKSSQNSDGPTPADNARLFEQLISSMQAQQKNSSLSAGNYSELMKQMLEKISSSSSSVSSSAASSTISLSSVSSSKTSVSSVSRSISSQQSAQSLASSMTDEEMRQLIQLLLAIMENRLSSVSASSSMKSSVGSSAGTSAAVSSLRSSSVSSVAQVVPSTLDGFTSSLRAVVQAVDVPVEPVLSAAVLKAMQGMTQAQASLAQRLTSQLTLMPRTRSKVYAYIVQELALAPINPTFAEQVFFGLKLENGRDLMSQGYVQNPDIDPKDWYAAAVGYAESKGLMKGQGNGLFTPEKSLNQAELAAMLANALKQRGGIHTAAPAGKAYASWPTWGQNAVSELHGKGVNVAFFTANALSPVTRLQIARAITDTLFPGRQLQPLPAKYFGDTAKLPVAVQSYVTAVSSLGIMTGKGTTGLFDPYGLVNRAEAAKIFATAVDAVQEVR